MPDILLVADTKRPTGSRPSRRLRHAGRIPAVVYGHGLESTAISVDSRALRAALSTSAGRNAVFELDVDGTHHLAMAKMVDHHPVRHTISHVDFLVIDRNETVTADVRITLVGEAEAVGRENGTVEQVLYSLTLNMLPGQIPDAIEVDISALVVGATIRVADLALPADVTTQLDEETPVVSAVAAQAEVVAEPTAEAAGEPETTAGAV